MQSTINYVLMYVTPTENPPSSKQRKSNDSENRSTLLALKDLHREENER